MLSSGLGSFLSERDREGQPHQTLGMVPLAGVGLTWPCAEVLSAVEPSLGEEEEALG